MKGDLQRLRKYMRDNGWLSFLLAAESIQRYEQLARLSRLIRFEHLIRIGLRFRRRLQFVE